MADQAFDVTLPNDRLDEATTLVKGMQQQGASDQQIAEALRRIGAKDAHLPPPVDPGFLDFLKKKQAEREGVFSIFAQHDPTRIGPPVPPSVRAEAELYKADRPGGMEPAIDPIDMLAGGLQSLPKAGLRGAARIGAEIGASEGAGAISSHLAGAAGLPPWAQSVLGVAGGLAPMGARLARPRAAAPVAAPPARVPDEVLPPLGPPKQLEFRGTGRGRANPIPDRGSIPMREMPPADRQIPYQTRALPPPGERIPEERRLTPPAFVPEMARGGLKVRRRQALPPIRQAMRATPEGLRPYFEERGTAKQPGSSITPPWTPLRDLQSPEEYLDEAAGAPARVRAAIKTHGYSDPDTARALAEAYEKQPTNKAFNPFTLPPEGYKRYHDLIGEIRSIREAHFPSRETLDAAPFAARLERQGYRDFARAATDFRAKGFRDPGKQTWWANRMAYNELKPGMKVLTEYGPGVVKEKTPTGMGARSIARYDARGKESFDQGYTRTSPTTATVKLDSGEEVRLGAQKILRVEHETKYAGEIPSGHSAAPFKRVPQKRQYRAMPAHSPDDDEVPF